MDIINKLAVFLDDHVRILTNIGYFVVGIGVLTMARQSRLMTKFYHPSEIPNNFVHKRIKLRASVKDVFLENVIELEHVPAFKKPDWLSNHKKSSPDRFLQFGIAGVRLNKSGCLLLKKELGEKHVWFEIVSSTRPMTKYPPAVIYARKYGILRNMNVHAVRNGYGLADSLPHCDHVTVQNRLQRTLFKAQRYAAKKRIGVWSE